MCRHLVDGPVRRVEPPAYSSCVQPIHLTYPSRVLFHTEIMLREVLLGVALIS